MVTTHSPYILSSFNNLIEAGKISADTPDKKEAVFKVVPESEVLDPSKLYAYSISKGDIKILIDSDTKLISQNDLDSVSDDLAIDFGELLEIEF